MPVRSVLEYSITPPLLDGIAANGAVPRVLKADVRGRLFAHRKSTLHRGSHEVYQER